MYEHLNYCCFTDLSELLCVCFGMQVMFFLSVGGGGGVGGEEVHTKRDFVFLVCS